MSDRMVIRNAFVLSMDADVGDVPHADILIEGGVITEICPSPLEVEAVEVDAAGTVATPGFVNTHRHLWNKMLKGFLANCVVADHAEKVLGGAGRCITREDVYVGELLGARGALNAGATSILDWSYSDNGPDRDDRK